MIKAFFVWLTGCHVHKYSKWEVEIHEVQSWHAAMNAIVLKKVQWQHRSCSECGYTQTERLSGPHDV